MKYLPNSIYRLSIAGLLFAFAFSLSGCGGFKIVRIPIPIPTFGIGGSKVAKKTTPRKVGGKIVSPKVQVGMASWYGRKFHGRRTANGERYNMYAMTAAHQTLPFGTKVKVTNLDNGKVVYVRINDRGPFKPGRIIDLSRKGASELGFLQQGLTRVRVEPL